MSIRDGYELRSNEVDDIKGLQILEAVRSNAFIKALNSSIDTIKIPPWSLGINDRCQTCVLLDTSALITFVSELTWDANNAANYIKEGDTVGRDKQLIHERQYPGINKNIFSRLLDQCDLFYVLQQTINEMEVIKKNNMGPTELSRLEQLMLKIEIIEPISTGPRIPYYNELEELKMEFIRLRSELENIDISEYCSRYQRMYRKACRDSDTLLEWINFRINPSAFTIDVIKESKQIRSRHMDLLRVAIVYHIPIVTADERFVRSSLIQSPNLQHSPYFIPHPSRSSVGY